MSIDSTKTHRILHFSLLVGSEVLTGTFVQVTATLLASLKGETVVKCETILLRLTMSKATALCKGLP